MELIVDPNWTYVLKSTQKEELDWLYSFLEFDDQQAEIAATMRAKYTGYARQVAQKLVLVERLRDGGMYHSRFPTGLLPMVQKGSSIQPSITAQYRAKSLPPVSSVDLEWLRSYQLESLFKAIWNKQRGILWLPTASGKTEIAIGLTKVMPGKWLFLVHRDTLRDQAVERYKSRGLHAKAFDTIDFACSPWGADLYVATFQSIYAGLRKEDPQTVYMLKGLDGVLVDECHVAAAQTFWAVLMACDAPWRFGISGTPLSRGDKKSIFAVAALGPVIHRVTASTLIEQGVIAKPRIVMRPTEPVYLPPTASWATIYRHGVVKNEGRNTAVVGAARMADKPCLVYVSHIPHGKLLKDMIQKSGISVEFVHGTSVTETRKAAISRLERGDTDILIASVILQAGIDIPSLASVVIASAGRSVIDVIQKVGRALRKVPGKDTCTIYDFKDTGCETLERHSQERAKAYSKEGYEVVYEGVGTVG